MTSTTSTVAYDDLRLILGDDPDKFPLWSTWRWPAGKRPEFGQHGAPPVFPAFLGDAVGDFHKAPGAWRGLALHLHGDPILFAGADLAELHPVKLTVHETLSRVRQYVSGATDAAKATAGPFNLTDCGNADRLVKQFGDELRYCHDWQRWLIWDGQRWQVDRNGDIAKRTRTVARSILIEAATIEDTETRKSYSRFSFKSESRERQAAMAAMAQHELAVLPEHLDADPWLLNCRSGTINLRTGKLQPANRADLLTKLAPVDFDQTAKCPQWEKFLDRIFSGKADLIEFVQQAIGYSLTGSIREQCVFILHGAGCNGKSTLLETISSLLGDDFAQQAAPDLLMMKKFSGHPTELAELRGARLVTAVESGEGRRLNEPLIKQMSGGDRIKAHFMRCDGFQFRPVFKLFLATNHRPEIRGTDVGIWRRIRLIPFDVKIPSNEVDPDLPSRLLEELPGILQWSLSGCLTWQQAGRLVAPASVTAATDGYRTEQDVLAAWLADCCVTGPNCRASAANLYRSYVEWCEQTGEQVEKQRVFGRRLAERGFETYHGTGGYKWWRGIGIVDQVDEVDQKSTSPDPLTSSGPVHAENWSTSSTSSTRTGRRRWTI